MDSRFFRIAGAVALAAGVLAAGDDRELVIIQGKGMRNYPARAWKTSVDGVVAPAGNSEFYRVPAGKTLVITEASFTLRCAPGKVPRAARVTLTLKRGGELFEMAGFTGRLESSLGGNVVARRFSPGLQVPAGSEVRGDLAEPRPGTTVLEVDTTFYGYYR